TLDRTGEWKHRETPGLRLSLSGRRRYNGRVGGSRHECSTVRIHRDRSSCLVTASTQIRKITKRNGRRCSSGCGCRIPQTRHEGAIWSRVRLGGAGGDSTTRRSYRGVVEACLIRGKAFDQRGVNEVRRVCGPYDENVGRS